MVLEVPPEQVGVDAAQNSDDKQPAGDCADDNASNVTLAQTALGGRWRRCERAGGPHDSIHCQGHANPAKLGSKESLRILHREESHQSSYC